MCNRYRMTAKEIELARACGFDPPYAPDEFCSPPADLLEASGIRSWGCLAAIGVRPGIHFLITEPNGVVAPIHPKATPLILHDVGYGRWLRAPTEEALTLAAPFQHS